MLEWKETHMSKLTALCKDVYIYRKHWKEMCLASVSIKVLKNDVHSYEMKSNPKKS